MGLLDSIRRVLLGSGAGGGLGVGELARRLGVSEAELRPLAQRPRYRPFKVKKRAGGQRIIEEPEEQLKRVQRLILRRLLGRLRAHSARARAKGSKPA